MATEDERRIGLEILKKVRQLNLPLKLDEITEGRGNCFPLAIIAQCRRSDHCQTNNRRGAVYGSECSLLLEGLALIN